MELDLCEEVVSEMVRLGFKESSVSRVRDDSRTMDARGKSSVYQRTALTVVLYNVLLGGVDVPRGVRMGLNVATTVEGWLDDQKLTILPFLKNNEDMFFV